MEQLNWMAYTNIRNVETKGNVSLLVRHMNYGTEWVFAGVKKE